MEHAPGRPLHEVWPSMDMTQKIACIQSISEQIKTMTNLDLPAYGSIYFAENNDRDDRASTLFLDEKFRLGPHCGSRYWDCTAGEQRWFNGSTNAGPCKHIFSETSLKLLTPC